jgi:hypothetical protein
MRIDPATLIAVTQNFFARYDATTQAEVRTHLAFEAVGMLRAFVRGYEDEEEVQVRHYEATAHVPDDEDPF